VFTEPITASHLFDLGGYVYLYDEKNGLFIFDYYGALKNRIALLDWKQVHPVGKQIIGIKNKSLVSYTPGAFDTKEFPLVEKLIDFDQIHFSTNGCYLLKSGSVYKYDWKK
jgi:hypothetical protein